MLKQPDDQQASRQLQGVVIERAVAEDGAPCLDWIEAQLSRLELLLCSPAEPAVLARFLLHELAPLVHAAQGAAYVSSRSEPALLTLAAGYAAGDGLPARIAVGQGLIGQCAADRRKLIVQGVSADHFRVQSALGSSAPAAIAVVPVALDDDAIAVVELAWVGAREPAVDVLLDRLAQRRPSAGASGPVATSTPTELRPAATVPVSSRQSYWSTLSHELRSPLNSVIVLSHVLAENAERNLSDKQVNLARVIHGSGKDLLALVDNISLLAKIEAHRLVLSPGVLELAALRHQIQRTIGPLAAARGQRLSIELRPDAPGTLLTDGARVRQIVECMLAAVIERGEGARVSLRIGGSSEGWSPDNARLNGARAVLAFEVQAVEDDTFNSDALDAALTHERPMGAQPAAEGVTDEPDPGVPGPGSLARGGALGLAISRELAALLGGELRSSEQRAAFSLYLPLATCDAAITPPALSGEDEPSRSNGMSRPGAGAVFGGGACTEDVAASSLAAGEVDGGRPALAPSGADDLEGLEILLVDSDVRQAFTLTGHLERRGAVVAHTEDLTEVVERLRGRRPPSAVLLDARVLGASPELSVQRLLRLAEQTPFVVLREAGDFPASVPRVHRLSRSADAREVVALLRRVAVPVSSLQTRTR